LLIGTCSYHVILKGNGCLSHDVGKGDFGKGRVTVRGIMSIYGAV
jgi:hypothetical protein